MTPGFFEIPETGVRFTFVVLISFLVFSAYITGRSIPREQTRNNKYWKIGIIYIIIYSLIEGLRYLRQYDYMMYVELYLYGSEDKEPLFNALNEFLNNLSVPFPGAFITYSFIWITAVLIFLKEFKQYAALLLPLLVIAYWYNTENFIRQYIAFSFNLISIIFIIKRKYVPFILSSIIAGLFHSVGYILSIELILCSFIYKPISPLISSILYLYFVYIFDITFLNIFSNFISSFSGFGAIADHYLNNSDKWFSADAASENYVKSFVSQLANTYFDISLLIGGYYTYINLNSNKKKFLLLYNIFSLGCIGLQPIILLEVFRRFFTPLYALWPIILVYIHKEFVLKSHNKKLLVWLYSLYIYVFFYLFLKNILLSKSQLFIWDIIRY